MEKDQLYETNKTARTILWVKNNLNYESNKNIESNNSSTIAIRIGYPNKKKINVIGIYRQHKLLNQNNKNQNDKEKENFENQCQLIKKDT